MVEFGYKLQRVWFGLELGFSWVGFGYKREKQDNPD